MNQETPAIKIKTKDLEENSQALAALIVRIPTQTVRSILDIRYGLGGWAREARKRFPQATIIGYEADAETVRHAWVDKGVNLLRSRYIPRLSSADLLLADFNVVTKLNRKPLDEVVKYVKARWLVFTDVACFRMHLNYRYYGIDRSDLATYWRAFDVPGYRLVGFARKHFSASTALYTNKNPR